VQHIPKYHPDYFNQTDDSAHNLKYPNRIDTYATITGCHTIPEPASYFHLPVKDRQSIAVLERIDPRTDREIGTNRGDDRVAVIEHLDPSLSL